MTMISHLRNYQVLVLVGAGGVGKTTLAAAVGLSFALRGRKVMVVTIDPARRLARALGLHQIGGHPHRIDLDELLENCRGTFDIMMLDSGQVFRSLVERAMTSEEQRQRILNNRFFQRFTEAMSGTQEHAAIEKLFELVAGDQYNMIILDTPPSRHALEFLNSPTRLLAVLDDAVLRWLIKPATSGLSMISFGSKYIAKVLSLFTGTEMLLDLTEFLTLFSDQLAGFRERAFRVQQLLQDRQTGYMIVSSPERHAMEGALMFHRALKKAGFALSCLVINRAWRVPDHPITGDLLGRQLKKGFPEVKLPDGFSSRAYNAYMHRLNVARIHHLKAQQIIAMTNLEYPAYIVPALVDEIVNLSGIYEISRFLFREQDQRDQVLL
ncbi:ArsA family ATPase [candidate division CSSED10-310 bacterium]|uniref:ArsA family ATPase n=1 Tax=candidate division CSSED10-310 bacterium TaxID=2855610 RepID=A0ABV6YVX0_UNCC1